MPCSCARDRFDGRFDRDAAGAAAAGELRKRWPRSGSHADGWSEGPADEDLAGLEILSRRRSAAGAARKEGRSVWSARHRASGEWNRRSDP